MNSPLPQSHHHLYTHTTSPFSLKGELFRTPYRNMFQSCHRELQLDLRKVSTDSSRALQETLRAQVDMFI